MNDVASAPRRSVLQRLMLGLRIVIPLAVLGYLLVAVDLHDTLASLRSISPWAFAGGLVIGLGGVLIAAWRWQLLFAACGIRDRPGVPALYGLHLVGHFYNSCLPGGVGGDVVRAVAVRGVMGERGLPGALAVVLLERTLGLAGMIILVAGTFALFPLKEVPNVLSYAALGMIVAAVAVVSIVNGRRIARFLPAPLAKVAAALPAIEAPKPFAAALLLSVLTQSSGIFIGQLLLSSIAAVKLSESMVVMPLIGASAYFPLTIGGMGIREMAFVKMYQLVGIAEHDALAASLAYAAIIYIAAGVGGIVHALNPLTVQRSSGLG